MNSKLKALLIVLLIFSICLIPEFSFAQTIVTCAGGKDACTLRDLFHTVIKIINFLIGLAWMVALLLVFWGSYGLATSYGNSEKIAGAKGIIQRAVIGFFLVMAAFILINWVVKVLGGYSFEQMLQFLPIGPS